MPTSLLSVFMLHQHLEALPSHRALGEAGLQVHACAGPRDLHTRMHSATAPVCAVLFTPEDRDTALLVAFLRANSSAGIIALAPRGEADHRIQSILMGADICMPANLGARELAACVLSLQRRVGAVGPALPTATPRTGLPRLLDDAPRPAPSDARWHLLNNDWELVSPQGVHISLTHNERRLLRTLIDHPNTVFSRPELAEALSDALQQTKATSINMLVSRLRNKARHLGTEVPLSVLPGRGYTLTATVVRPAAADLPDASGGARLPGTDGARLDHP